MKDYYIYSKDYYIYSLYLFLNRAISSLNIRRIATFIGRASSVNPTVISSRHYATLPNGVQLAGNKVRYATSVRNKLGEEVARKRLAEEDAQGNGERKRAGEVKSKRKGTSC